jgi:hypothetical protein
MKHEPPVMNRQTSKGDGHMTAARDFSKITTDQLKRSLKFHENDRGAVTTAEECRRMFMVQEIGAELKRRDGASSVECPHCKWGIAPSAIDQHIREKH